MTNLLSSHLEDWSTPQYFCFSIRCEVCGEFWYSSSIPFSKALQAAEHREKKELYDAIYQREKQRAMQAAAPPAVPDPGRVRHGGHRGPSDLRGGGRRGV